MNTKSCLHSSYYSISVVNDAIKDNPEFKSFVDTLLSLVFWIDNREDDFKSILPMQNSQIQIHTVEYSLWSIYFCIGKTIKMLIEPVDPQSVAILAL